MMWVWFRAVRLRFLLSSVIAATLGAAVAWNTHGTINIQDWVVVVAGVAALHASVDLLNDYRDYRRGIDTRTRRTGMSGGSGVLPEGLLRPEQVRRVGIACLCAGAAVGSYYTYTHGAVVGVILGFAVLSIYFYSTRIVDWGLGETFVGIKGGLIVLGSHYIQTAHLGPEAALAGAAAGSLSALVLFVASFPDREADRAGGRRTIVIRLGPERAARLYWIFPGVFVCVTLYGVAAGIFPWMVAISLAALPLAVRAGLGMMRQHAEHYTHMRGTLVYSRISGLLLVAGFAVATPAIAGAV
ncbi:MAG: prenyltransferase [Nitrosopumilaceae archaeon]|nr:prenyltransferase [Nitrosopumilaceae archaeon]